MMKKTKVLLSSLLVFVVALIIDVAASGLFGAERAYAVESDDGEAISVEICAPCTDVSGKTYATGTLLFCRTAGSYEDVNNGHTITITDIHGSEYYGRVRTGVESWSGNLPLASNYVYYVDIAENTVIRPTSTFAWFSGCNKLQSCDFTGMDMSNVANMSYMFYGCSHDNFAVDTSSWNTSQVANMSYMFQDCSGASFETPDTSRWDTSKVTDMSYMFYGCNGASFEAPDTSRWDTSKVTNMSYMFYGCSGASFEAPDMSRWNTSLVSNMSYMFSQCWGSAFNAIDVSSFDISSLTDTQEMFCNCLFLTTIEAAENADWSNISKSSGMFSGCQSLVGGNGTAWSTSFESTAASARVDGLGERSGYFTAKLRTPGDDASHALPFIHTMKSSRAVDLSDITYTISTTPTDLSGANAHLVSEGARNVPAAVLAAKSTIVLIPSSNDDLVESASSEWTMKYENDKTLEQLFGDPDNFELPGLYFFDVIETATGGTAGDSSLWSYGNERYRICVHIVNDADGTAGGDLAYARWVVERLGDQGADKVNSLDFTSSYIAYQTLTVTKEVEGSFGNTSYDFPFEVTLVLPEWYDSASPIALVNAIQTSAPARTGDTGPFTAVYSAALHDGESATFTVPVGTCYKVDEKSAVAGSSAVLDGAGVAYDQNIEWEVSRRANVPAAPALPQDSAAFSSTPLSTFGSIGAYLRSGSADAAYVSQAEGLVGNTISVELADNSTVAFRLMDVSESRGLTFQAEDGIALGQRYNFDEDNEQDYDYKIGGWWSDSDLQKSMNNAVYTDNSGHVVNDGFYATYIAGSILSAEGLIHTVENESYYAHDPDTGIEITDESTDRFWVPSAAEIFGASAPVNYDPLYDELYWLQCEDSADQFDYYRINGTDDSTLIKNFNNEPCSWWIRSSCQADGGDYDANVIAEHGQLFQVNNQVEAAIAPCFCL